MNTLYQLAWLAAETEELDPNTVTPGVWGFIAIFAIAAATVALIFDMTRRIRRTNYRIDVKAKLDAEEEANRASGDVAPHRAASASDSAASANPVEGIEGDQQDRRPMA